MATLLTAVLMAVATAAIFVTTAPKWVSLAIEPVSLILLPGLIVSVVLAGPHDFSPWIVVWVSSGLYFVSFYGALWLRARRAAYARRGSR